MPNKTFKPGAKYAKVFKAFELRTSQKAFIDTDQYGQSNASQSAKMFSRGDAEFAEKSSKTISG
jgi:hypothetical protein